MYAGFSTSKSKQLVDSALSSRVTRNQLIASNIANIDTPFYKAKDIDFETALIEKREEVYKLGSNEPKLELARTNDKHFASIDFPSSKIPTIYLRDGHMARNDANTVDLDIETSEMSKNVLMIQALDSASKKHGDIFKSVIDASSKI